MKKKFASIVLFLAAFCTFSLEAWWDEGHMAIAQIAYDRLEPKVKEEADRLIGLLAPFFPTSSTFITAACWPDDLSHQGLSAFRSWHHSSLPYDPCHILSASQSECLCVSLEGKDVIYALGECQKTLSHPQATDWSKALMLRFFLHFVGDLHQPLHCISLYNPTFPGGDWGGNLFSIRWVGHAKSNLHAFWDAMCGLGEKKLPRPLNLEGDQAIKSLVYHITQTFPETCFSSEELENDNFYLWRAEGYELGVSSAYQGICLDESPSKAYIQKGQSIASSRAALAGYRLARLLNKMLKAS